MISLEDLRNVGPVVNVVASSVVYSGNGKHHVLRLGSHSRHVAMNIGCVLKLYCYYKIQPHGQWVF